ncbi:MAG: LysM peptidoglycan-binding domain-containing protein, partial [Chloroflexota bacterium]
MEQSVEDRSTWRSSAVLALGVVGTVLMALLLAVSDGLQVRLPPPRPTETAVVVAAAATTVVPPTVSLPTSTPTAPTPTPTTTVAATATGEKKPSTTPVAVVDQCGVIPSDWTAYTVRRGDTLFRLAINSGATVSALTVANCLDSNRIYAGMTLYLPETPPPAPPVCTGPPASWTRYTVQQGDTLFSLSRSRGTTVYNVLTANCLV